MHTFRSAASQQLPKSVSTQRYSTDDVVPTLGEEFLLEAWDFGEAPPIRLWCCIAVGDACRRWAVLLPRRSRSTLCGFTSR